MKKVSIKIDGMTCAACSSRIDKYLNKQDGINSSNTNLVLGYSDIEYDDNIINLKDIDRFISEAGYKSLGIYKEQDEEKQDKKNKLLLIVFGIIAILSFIMSIINIKILSIPLLIIAIIYLVYGKDIIISGINRIIKKSPNMDSLVTLGVLTSFIYSSISMFSKGNNYIYFDSVIMIIYIVKLGRYIESINKEKTKEAIKSLVSITPKIAIKKLEYKEKEIPIGEVSMDDILICKPGMRIAVDGIIVNGESHTNEAFINGESTPIKKKKGDEVIAGSINIDGYIEYKPLRIGPDSTISQVVNLVKEASNTKPSISKLVDRISNYFVPIIFLIALIALLVHLIIGDKMNEAIIYFVNVLVISCPCALGLATPLAVIVSVGNCANKGILIKRSSILEIASNIDTVIFDKTGTLTKGELNITKCITYSTYKEKELINIVANLESKSNHPIALAFKDYIDESIKILSYKEFPGIGFKGGIGKSSFFVGNDKIFKEFRLEKALREKNDEKELINDGNSIIYIFENKKLIGLIGVRDTIRNDAKKVIDELNNNNIDSIILSGDKEEVVKRIAEYLKVTNIKGELLPSDKTNYIKRLEKNNHLVMMVGDGINDAPSLSLANIGVSVNKSTDIAANSSDVILLKDDLNKVIELINIGKRTMKIIKMNLFWAFFYNIVMIPIAFGLFSIKITPMFSAIAMMLSSITVILNSLRLRK